MAVRIMVAIVVLLGVVIVALLQSGVFDSQPSSPEERNLVLIEQALKRDPNNALLLLDLAENEYALGRRGDAVDHAARAAEIASSTPMVNLRYAQVLMLTHDFDKAETHLNKELDLPGITTETGARFLLAQVYREQGRLDEALSLMARALKAEYQAADYRIVYADMLVDAKKNKEAIKQYREVLKYLPDDSHSIEALKKLGATYDSSGTVNPHSAP